MHLFIHQGISALMVISLCLSVFLTLGCGYHFRAVDTPSGNVIQSLSIPLIKTTSTSLGFEGDFTTIVRQEFASRAKVPLVSKEEAGAVLIAKVYEINTDPVSYNTLRTMVDDEETKYSVTSKRRMRIKLDAKLIDRVSGKSIWQDRHMSEKAIYEVSDDPLTNRYNQRKAFQKMARRFAERFYLKTMERF